MERRRTNAFYRTDNINRYPTKDIKLTDRQKELTLLVKVKRNSTSLIHEEEKKGTVKENYSDIISQSEITYSFGKKKDILEETNGLSTEEVCKKILSKLIISSDDLDKLGSYAIRFGPKEKPINELAFKISLRSALEYGCPAIVNKAITILCEAPKLLGKFKTGNLANNLKEVIKCMCKAIYNGDKEMRFFGDEKSFKASVNELLNSFPGQTKKLFDNECNMNVIIECIISEAFGRDTSKLGCGVKTFYTIPCPGKKLHPTEKEVSRILDAIPISNEENKVSDNIVILEVHIMSDKGYKVLRLKAKRNYSVGEVKQILRKKGYLGEQAIVTTIDPYSLDPIQVGKPLADEDTVEAITGEYVIIHETLKMGVGASTSATGSEFIEENKGEVLPNPNENLASGIKQTESSVAREEVKKKAGRYFIALIIEDEEGNSLGCETLVPLDLNQSVSDFKKELIEFFSGEKFIEGDNEILLKTLIRPALNPEVKFEEKEVKSSLANVAELLKIAHIKPPGADVEILADRKLKLVCKEGSEVKKKFGLPTEPVQALELSPTYLILSHRKIYLGGGECVKHPEYGIFGNGTKEVQEWGSYLPVDIYVPASRLGINLSEEFIAEINGGKETTYRACAITTEKAPGNGSVCYIEGSDEFAILISDLKEEGNAENRLKVKVVGILFRAVEKLKPDHQLSSQCIFF